MDKRSMRLAGVEDALAQRGRLERRLAAAREDEVRLTAALAEAVEAAGVEAAPEGSRGAAMRWLRSAITKTPDRAVILAAVVDAADELHACRTEAEALAKRVRGLEALEAEQHDLIAAGVEADGHDVVALRRRLESNRRVLELVEAARTGIAETAAGLRVERQRFDRLFAGLAGYMEATRQEPVEAVMDVRAALRELQARILDMKAAEVLGPEDPLAPGLVAAVEDALDRFRPGTKRTARDALDALRRVQAAARSNVDILQRRMETLGNA